MANPDDTTILGEDFIDTLVPSRPVAPRVEAHIPSDAPDRLVFFFSGFDPRSATFYHRLFRSGIAQRNATHDETLALGKRHRIGRWASVWTALWRGASSALGGRPVTMRTRVHFMRWDDIVRRHWRRAPLTLARDYWNIYAHGLASGVLARIWRAAPAAFWLAMLPLSLCTASIAAGLAIGVLLVVAGWASIFAGLASGLCLGALGWRVAARRIDCEWTLRLCAFMRQQALGEVPALDERLDEMASRLVEAVEARARQPGAGPLKEIAVIGYSSGTIMAASVLSRAMPRLNELVGSRRASKETTLSLVTLGHCIPIAAEWPQARRFRNELDVLAESARLTWHDYSSPADQAAFWNSPPWPQSAPLKTRQFLPPLPEGKAPGPISGGRRDRRERHLRYLRPPQERGGSGIYDFFALVFGPDTSARRQAAAGDPQDAAG